ncbi:RNA polymerase sigma factor SigJ [Pseudonocardia sp. C8]|uniref:RNA polymerase sigma factor SigJ n=1 Tax=Pseudonocardia sp. C8 TaxID=2762759 RepID=UPI00164348BD|nr:RNA polymerase sigma factor SigJ [Pseudonocardia sp. C8]
MPDPAPDVVTAFREHRAHLVAVGYRMTGSLADSEDAVQEAWLRLSRTGISEIRDLRAWLTTTVARLCLDRLRSAAVRREQHVGPWLPEPVVGGADPALDAVLQADDVRMAAMLVLERLTPPQRVAFVLHEALDLPFTEIADVLGCTEAAARQHASRARRVIADSPGPPPAPSTEAAEVLERFAAALATGDAGAVAATLHPEVVFVSDGGGVVRAARRPVSGADKVARLLVGLARKEGVLDGAPALVNGDPGWIVPGGDGARPAVVTAVAVRDGLVAGIYGVLDPSKLRP